MYSLEQAQIEADLMVSELQVPEDNGIYTKDEYDIAETIVGTKIIAFPVIINRLVELAERVK